MTERRFKPTATYGISRMRGGWEVRLVRGEKMLIKLFSFTICGGEDAALIRAQAWRDEMVHAHPPMARQARANKLRRNNSSGFPGVVSLLGPNGEPSGWMAQTYLGPGKKLTKYFSVGRHGPEAKMLAIAERQKQLQQMTGLLAIHPGEVSVREAPLRPVPADLPTPATRAEVVLSSNRSGVSGVHRKVTGQHPYWVAMTSVGNGNKDLRKSFSIKTYGEEEAKGLAIAERRRQLVQARLLSAGK